MPKTKFLFIASFRVDEAISAEFQKWMEEVHFPDMHKTMCFLGKVQKVLDVTSQKGFHTITYTHQMYGESSWKTYNRVHREKLLAEFMKKYKLAMQYGQLSVILTAGHVSEV